MKNILGSAAVFTALSINCFGQCGVERWAVKTGTDADSRLVNPAQRGETVVLYGVGFGLPATTLVDGSATQFGILPVLPVIQIGGVIATVQFAGVISPGLYQFNVVIPTTAANGDNSLTATYGGFTTPSGSLIAVQR